MMDLSLLSYWIQSMLLIKIWLKLSVRAVWMIQKSTNYQPANTEFKQRNMLSNHYEGI